MSNASSLGDFSLCSQNQQISRTGSWPDAAYVIFSHLLVMLSVNLTPPQLMETLNLLQRSASTDPWLLQTLPFSAIWWVVFPAFSNPSFLPSFRSFFTRALYLVHIGFSWPEFDFYVVAATTCVDPLSLILLPIPYSSLLDFKTSIS